MPVDPGYLDAPVFLRAVVAFEGPDRDEQEQQQADEDVGAVQARQREEDRRFFWLYVDEFHQFATPSMAAILSGARKYRLGLILAHQELQQLEKVPEVASAVGNTYTRVCFRLSDQDARKLESGFMNFTAHDLQNLGMGEAICRASA